MENTYVQRSFLCLDALWMKANLCVKTLSMSSISFCWNYMSGICWSFYNSFDIKNNKMMWMLSFIYSNFVRFNSLSLTMLNELYNLYLVDIGYIWMCVIRYGLKRKCLESSNVFFWINWMAKLGYVFSSYKLLNNGLILMGCLFLNIIESHSQRFP